MKTKITAERETQALLSGVWHNQHNSEMRLEIDETGKIAGAFMNGVDALGDCSETFPLTGFAKDDIFAFCVDFSKYGCMTTWIGQIVDSESKSFRAMWHMVADAHQDKRLDWKSIWTGQDEFSAGPRKSELSNQPGPKSHPMFCGII
jgi:hypothetical protein